MHSLYKVSGVWIPFLMITLDLPSSEGTCLCPVQSAGRVLALVSVSVCCKKVGGRIHQRYKDRCYSDSWSSRHTGTDIETEPVILVNIYILSLGFVKYERELRLWLWCGSQRPPTRRFTCKNDWQWLFDCEEYYWVVFRSLCLFDWLDCGKVMVNHQRRSARVIEWTQSGCILSQLKLNSSLFIVSKEHCWLYDLWMWCMFDNLAEWGQISGLQTAWPWLGLASAGSLVTIISLSHYIVTCQGRDS